MDERFLRIAVMTAFSGEDWHSQRLLEACARYGEATAVDPADLSVELKRGELKVRVGPSDACAFDAFLLARGMSPRGDADVQFAVYRALEDVGAVVVNRIGPLLDAQDKFRTSFLLKRAGVPTPRAGAVQTTEDAVRMVQALGDVVLKPLAASLGDGVERVKAGEGGEERAAERVEREGALYLQRYVENPGRDVRVFVVGGEVVGAVQRIAADGEWRTNMARGARAEPVELTHKMELVAEHAARVLALDYTGVDLVETPEGPQVIEVNGNPSFDMILQATGKDMAEEIAAYVARRALSRRLAREQRLQTTLEFGLM